MLAARNRGEAALRLIYGPVVDLSDAIDPIVEIAGIRAAHDALLERLDGGAPDPATPSRLPGWTVGHVLSHVEHNADSFRAVLLGRSQYAGFDERNAAIDAAATRPLREIVASMRRSNDRLVAAFESETDWDRRVEMLVRPTRPRLMTLARRREIEVHHLDLDLGRVPADLDAAYVERDTALLTTWWETTRERRLPPPVATQPPLERWLWLVGRHDVDGLEPADLF